MRDGLFNALSVLFFVLTLVVVTGVFALLAFPAPVDTDIVRMPSVAPELPTVTPTETGTATPTPTRTLPATFTPVPPSATPTSTATHTTTPQPSMTPSLTFTPSNTPTPTDTPVPFPYRLQGEPQFRDNFANSLGCDWQGVGGQVFDTVGQELQPEQANRLRIHIFNDRVDTVLRLGTNSFYGERTGWEVRTSGAPARELVYVRLELVDGTPQSNDAQINFPSGCDSNLAVVNFMINPAFPR